MESCNIVQTLWDGVIQLVWLTRWPYFLELFPAVSGVTIVTNLFLLKIIIVHVRELFSGSVTVIENYVPESIELSCILNFYLSFPIVKVKAT